MFKTTVIALVAAASMIGVAAPAYAESNDGMFSSGDFNGQEIDASARATAAQNIVSRLQEKGINATSVEQWGTLVRAYVTLEDGRQVNQFFTPGTLNQVAL